MRKTVLVIPTFNEEENIGRLIRTILALTKDLKDEDFHILVSDSNSGDNTKKKVEEITATSSKVHFLDVKKRGLGLGLKMGFSYASGRLGADVLGQIDADFSHDPRDIPKLLDKLNEGCDLVLGSRLVRGGKNLLPTHRRVFSFGASLIGRFLMGVSNVHEFTTSFRFFKKEVFQKLLAEKKINRNDWTFIPVFVTEAALEGYRIAEVPIVFTDRKEGKSKMNTPHFILNLMTYAAKTGLKKRGRFIKFLIVGGIGLIINAVGLRILVERGNIHPAVANLIAAEIAIISNFTWNNLWTFAERKVTRPQKLIYKLIEFNFTSVIGVIFIQTATIFIGVRLFGKSLYMAYFVIGTGLLLIWNFTVYNKIIWKKVEKTK